jgi:hypothetical protein
LLIKHNFDFPYLYPNNKRCQTADKHQQLNAIPITSALRLAESMNLPLQANDNYLNIMMANDDTFDEIL